MGRISTSRNKNFWATRLVGAVTAAAYLVTILGAAPAEASFWEDRAAARSRLDGHGGQSPTLLAQLPASQAFSFGTAIRPTSLAAPSPSLSKVLASTPLWARRAVTPYADVRVVREGRSSDIQFFLIMDAHEVYSAQQNVARLLESLGAQGKMIVGVEGTTGAFDLERHRGLLPSPAQEQLTDHLLRKGFINGPEAFGLTAATAPHLWGVEEPALYDANVRAYRDSLSAEGETRSALAVLKKEGFERQKTVFSEALQKLDREVQAMHEDRGDLGRYATEIVRGAGGVGGQHVQRFLDAKALEDKISFPAVEQARAAFIERLSPRLSTAEMAKLVQETTVFRTGGESAKDYYQMIESVGLSKGVPLSAYPAFREYITYVSLADGIDAAQLMEELDALEERAYRRLATGESLSLAEWNKDLRLAERAVDHALTPLEWERFEVRRGDLARLKERAESFGFSTAAAETVQTQLPKFAAFFEAAEARNKTLLDNTLAEARRQGANTAVLVTGGFHAPALEKRLISEKIPHAVLSPRVAEVPESGAGYLQAFAPTRTPLERLLLGDRLFMNPPSATAVAVQNPSDPFHGASLALDKATVSYGTVLAAPMGKLGEFIDRWNQRFGDMGRAVARVVSAGAVDVVHVTFAGNNKPALLVATASGSDSVSSEVLNSAVSQQGGKVVDQGEVGGVAYALGGKNVTRVLPEILGAVGFVALYWGSALSPPLYAVGLLGWMVLGGISLRGILLGSSHMHEMGHAITLQWLGGRSVQESLVQYKETLSIKHIIPFSTIFIPGLSPSNEAPRMSVGDLSQGWKIRVTAIAGPVVNLIAFGVLFLVAWAADPTSTQQWFFGTLAGVNFWVAMTSMSDFKIALYALGDALYCGNVGVLGKRHPEYKRILPNKIDNRLARMWRQIIVRGGQSGGRATLGMKGFIRKRKLNIKRAKLDHSLRSSFIGEILRRRLTGSRPIEHFIQEMGHARWATGGPSEEKNAHPFVWGMVDGLWNALFPRRAKIWAVGEGGILKNSWRVAQQLISHNGDFDAWIRQTGETPIQNNGALATWLTKSLGREDLSDGDSPKIAGMMEILLTQGQWGASFRLAYAMDVADSIDDVMKQSDVRKVGRAADNVFEAWLKGAQVAGARTLQDVFNQNKGRIDDLKNSLLNATRLDTHGLNQEKKELLAERAIHYFFFNDLEESGRLFSDRADGTFCYVLGSSLYPGEILFATYKQSMYVGYDLESEMFAYASELASVKAAGEPGKNRLTELLPYIYFMEDGEVAHFKLGEGDIPNSTAFPNGFDYLGRTNLPDLSGSEKGGRHSLTAENLERWSSQNEREGGRGWIGTKGNKNLSGGVLVSESDDLVLDTLNDIPRVLATINADWEGQNPTSSNLETANDFAAAVLERARVRSLTRYQGDPAYKNQIDLLVLGAEYGFYAGEHFATDLKSVFPGMKVEAVDSKSFAVDPESYAVGPNTIVLAISHSGQYFHTVDDVVFLNTLHEQGRCGPVFGMAGLFDSVPLGQALGQSYKASAKSNHRIFVTHAGWRLDEPKPVVPLATEMTLSHLMIIIAEKAKSKKFGRAVTDDTIRRLKEGQDYLQERSESIFGANRKGQKIDAQEHKDLVAVGHRYSQRLTEFLVAMPLAAVHLFVVLYLGGNPVQASFDGLFALSQWGVFTNTTTIGHFFITYWQVPYFIMAYFVAAFMLRVVQRRPRWGRYVSAPTLFLGDTRFVHKTMEVYLRKLFSLSFGWASWGEFKTGDTGAAFIDEATPSVKRGDVMFNGLPTQNRMRAMVQMTATQLRGSLSLNSTAESFALGHEAPSEGKFNGHSVLAQEDAERVEQIRGSESVGGTMNLLESRVFSIERLMALDVIFHANAARTRDLTNVFIQVLRWVAWPLFFLMRVVSLGKFEVPLFPWDIAETHGRANIFTTQVGKPISVSVEDFSPEAFWVNGEPVLPQASLTSSHRPNVNMNSNASLWGETDKKPLKELRELAGFLNLSPEQEDSAAALKGQIRTKIQSSEVALTVPAIYEEALLSALAGRGVGAANGVVHLDGSLISELTLSLARYRRQRKLGQVPSHESVIVSFSKGTFEILLNAEPQPQEKVDQGGDRVFPDETKSQEAEMSALAAYLGITEVLGGDIQSLVTRIEGVLAVRERINLPAQYRDALVFALSNFSRPDNIVFDVGKDQRELWTLSDYKQLMELGYAPDWESYRVVSMDGKFMVSEGAMAGTQNETHVPAEIDMYDRVAETARNVEEVAANHPAHDALIGLAEFLNLGVAENEGDERLADLIEEKMKSVENLKIPGAFEGALPYVLSRAETRENNRVFSLFLTRKLTGPQSLTGYLLNRHETLKPWDSYYVSFRDTGRDVRYFRFSPTPHEEEVDDDAIAFEGEGKVRSPESRNRAAGNDLRKLTALADDLGLIPAKGSGISALAEQIRVELSFRETWDIPVVHEDAIFIALSKGENAPQNKVLITADGKPISFARYLNARANGTSPAMKSIRVSKNGDSFLVSPTPEIVVEDEPVATAAQKDEAAWEQFMHDWITRPVVKVARVTVFLIGIISLTSWGGNLMTGFDRTLSQIFNRSAFSQELERTGHVENVEFWTSKSLSAADHKESQNSEENAVNKVGQVNGHDLPSSDTKVSVVNTRVTGLMSYENHPYDGVRFLGKVEPSVVRVLHRDGAWVNIDANGQVGWVHSKHLFNLKGGKARVVNTSSFFDARPYENVGKRGRFPKGAALEVLEEKGGWAKVKAFGSRASPVWVSGRFLKAVQAGQMESSVKPEVSQNRGVPVPSALGQPTIEKGPLAPLLVPMVPVLGLLGRRRVPVSTSPGALLRQRLLSGARRGWEGETIPVAKAVLAFAENPSDTAWGDQGIRLALGYGALAGGTWAKDRALVNDFRRTREELKGQPLTVLEGRKLTGLARLASSWERASTPNYVDGGLQVINLTSAETETQLLHYWAVALDRVVSHGGQMPVLVAKSREQRDRLEASLKAWRAENKSLGLAIPTEQTRWIYSENLSSEVAQRDAQGMLQSVRMGALLKMAGVDIRNLQSIDLVTGVQPDWIWDRSDLPSEVAVRLIMGVLKDLSLSAPLESAQNAIRSARKALTAA